MRVRTPRVRKRGQGTVRSAPAAGKLCRLTEKVPPLGGFPPRFWKIRYGQVAHLKLISEVSVAVPLESVVQPRSVQTTVHAG